MLVGRLGKCRNSFCEISQHLTNRNVPHASFDIRVVNDVDESQGHYPVSESVGASCSCPSYHGPLLFYQAFLKKPYCT